jgi:hypothetical protein
LVQALLLLRQVQKLDVQYLLVGPMELRAPVLNYHLHYRYYCYSRGEMPTYAVAS